MPGDQVAAVLQSSEPDRKVDIVLEQIARRVGERKAEGQPRMWLGDLDQERQQHPPAVSRVTFDYICRYHPNMTGKIIVEP